MNWDRLSEQLIRHEGLRLRAYQDHLGFWTIGVGHLIDPRKGGDTRYKPLKSTTITRKEALELLREDVSTVARGLDANLPWWTQLDDARQNVLVEMGFQLGVPGLLKFKNTLRAVKEGRWADAAKGMMGSLWAKQTPARAETLAAQMWNGA